MRDRDVETWDLRAREGFTYVSDGVIDSWFSHAEDVLGGRRWQGDCDDLVSTVQDLLGRAGLALEQRFRLLVATRPGPQFDHMVGCAIDQVGRFWVVGDTFGAMYRAYDCRHRVVAYQRLDQWLANGEPDWRDGAPWEGAHV